MHVALQGCLRGTDVEYGVSADTGGHIRYLMQLVAASARDPAIDRIDMVTRAFDADFTGGDYRRRCEYLNPKTRIVRIPTPNPGYLSKEALWPELPAFTAALGDYVAALDRKPDFVHAHYADAAEVAGGLRARHGIPFVFTAHSLGRPKRKCRAAAGAGTLALDEQRALTRRIDFEERALDRASLIVASSRDEAEIQYAGYDRYDPGRIRVIPPGSDLYAFESARPTERVGRALARFLSEPDKPALLAIARPVTRKNLTTLIRAYGESPELQTRANLVILAGNRDCIDALEPELAANLRDMLALIDRYDLYGRVAYPKRHRGEDVPAVYAWARERRGVFVNPALNEPFGLTLLEAAAAGLPVVATDSGGPNDIIEQCDNGVLVNPCCASGIADAALTLLTDPAAWQRCAANGARAVRAYDWREHSARYHALLARLKTPPRVIGASETASMLVCDIDGTLTGSDCGIRDFNGWYSGQPNMIFGVATGRSFHSALKILEQAGGVWPRFVISSVGSEIYHLAADATTYERDRSWQTSIDQDWDRAAIVAALEAFDDLLPQGSLEQRCHKLSYLSGDDPQIGARVRERLRARQLECTVICSHGRYLDILPAGACKSAAIAQVRHRFGLAADQVYVAGDSGNDVDMLRTASRSIIVANCRDGLAGEPGLEHAYRARLPHAGGVIEGVQHFRKQARNAS